MAWATLPETIVQVDYELAELISHEAATGRTSTPGTMGLGLWISQELTRLMGGSLTYDRVDGETVFKAAIPLLKPGTHLLIRGHPRISSPISRPIRSLRDVA